MWCKFKYNQILAIISVFICGSKLARIHKAGYHHAALTGCGGRESADAEATREYKQKAGNEYFWTLM